MKKYEGIILGIFIIVLISINIIGYFNKKHRQKSYELVIEQERMQISLNHAALDELDDLPGIGPVLAAKIIAYRERYGPFSAVEDVKKVKGIGDKLFKKIMPYITL